jgi:hypothetical protein
MPLLVLRSSIKTLFDFALVDVVKRIEHNTKTISQRRFCQRILVDFPGIKLATGIEILTSGRGDLLRCLRQMATQMLAERDSKIFEQDEVAAVAFTSYSAWASANL